MINFLSIISIIYLYYICFIIVRKLDKLIVLSSQYYFGEAFEKEFPNEVKAQKLGQGIIKVINSKSLIDFARQWFDKKDHQFGNAVD